MKKKPRNPESGFTLIELSVALVVIGIVAIFLAPKITNIFGKTQIELANQELISLVTAAVSYRNLNGNYAGLGTSATTAAQGLGVLANNGYYIAPFTGNGNSENAYGAVTSLVEDAAPATATLTYTTDEAAQCNQLIDRVEDMGDVGTPSCATTVLTVPLN